MILDSILRDFGVHLDWQYVLSYTLLLAPAVVPGVLFIYSFIKEPRQFRNALFLFAALTWTSVLLVFKLNSYILGLVLVIIVVATPFLTIGFLLINTIIVLEFSLLVQQQKRR